MKLDCLHFQNNYPFIAVGYYTNDDLYKNEWEKLKKDLKKWKVSYHFEEIESRGSWQKNTQYKPKFILDKLKQYPNTPLLYLDVDSRVVREPCLFKKLSKEVCDIAVHYIDWSLYKKEVKNSKILDSAVVYLSGTSKSFEIVQKWIECCKKYLHKWDQKCLQEVIDINYSKIRLFNLPAEYCCIYDRMLEVDEPVIKQYQASRRAKTKGVNKRQGIFIAGCPRSMTSMVAGCFERCGAAGGDMVGAAPCNKGGMYENKMFKSFIKKTLTDLKCDKMGQVKLPSKKQISKLYNNAEWMTYWKLYLLKNLKQEKMLNKIWFLKDCKVLLLRQILPLMFPQSKWVLVYRPVDHILKSMKKMPWCRFKNDEEIRSWILFHHQLIDNWALYTPNVFKINSEDIVQGKYSNLQAIVELCGLKFNRKEIDKWVSPNYQTVK